MVRSRDALRPIRKWIDGGRDPESTERRLERGDRPAARSWSSSDLPLPVIVSVLPTCIAGIAILDLSWLAIFPLLAGSAVALGYSAMLHYLAVEAGMRPVLIDINQQISPRPRRRARRSRCAGGCWSRCR